MPAGLVVTYLLILGLIYLLARSCWRPMYFLFLAMFKGALGALGIYLFNSLLGIFNWTWQIPLNPFNSLYTGFLGIPGLVSLVIAKYWISV